MIVIEGITSKGESVGEYLKSKLLRLYYYSWKKNPKKICYLIWQQHIQRKVHCITYNNLLTISNLRSIEKKLSSSAPSYRKLPIIAAPFLANIQTLHLPFFTSGRNWNDEFLDEASTENVTSDSYFCTKVRVRYETIVLLNVSPIWCCNYTMVWDTRNIYHKTLPEWNGSCREIHNFAPKTFYGHICHNVLYIAYVPMY